MTAIRIVFTIIIFLGCFVFVCLVEAGSLDSFHMDLVIERTKDSIRIQKDLAISRKKDNEIVRGQDIKQSVKDTMTRKKEAIRTMQSHMSNGAKQFNDIARTRMMMMKETMRQTAVQQDLNRRQQQDRLRQIKEQTTALKQRLKDNSR